MISPADRPDAGPVTENARIDAIDVLRGAALLGILVMNVQAFAMPQAAYFNPTAYGDLEGANLYVWLAGRMLADQKFMTIFSMLFGAGFAEVEPRAAVAAHATKVLRAPASEPLGAVLDAAVEASSGTLLTKMDDDDAYGADHLWDLVLAREYSGAQLVGKWLEFVYLAASDRTMRWFNGRSERYQASVLAGGTLLVSRRDLDRAGGWRKAPRGVDTALAADVLQAGGRIYRTHAAGFMMVRHGCGHTWNDADGSDDSFLARADRVWPGFQPGRAGVEAPRIPHPALSPSADRTPPGAHPADDP